MVRDKINVEKINSFFTAIGEFAKRMVAIIVAAGLAIGGGASLYAFVFTKSTTHTKILFQLVLAVVLAFLLLLAFLYVILLRNERAYLKETHAAEIDELNQTNRLVLDDLDEALLKIDSLKRLSQSQRSVEKQVATMLQRDGLTQRERRLRCIQYAVIGSRDNTLTAIENHEKRFAFLEYDKPAKGFIVHGEIGLVPESYRDVQTGLTQAKGLAARAIELRSTRHIPDVTAPEATDQGWVRVGSELRHKSIVCIDCWLDDRPIGVLSADSVHPAAFTQEDIEILERFGEMIEMICGALPDPVPSAPPLSP